MGHIGCKLTYKATDKDGVPREVRFRMLESDMADTNIYELPIYMHALSVRGAVSMWMKLDEGILDRDILGKGDLMRLDYERLDVDILG